MAASVLHVNVDTSRKVALEHLQVTRGGCLVDGAVSIHIDVEWRHADFEQEPNDLIEALVTGPVQRRIFADLPRILRFDERVHLFLIFGCLLLRLFRFHILIRGPSLDLEIRCGSIPPDQHPNDLLVAIARGPKQWTPTTFGEEWVGLLVKPIVNLF